MIRGVSIGVYEAIRRKRSVDVRRVWVPEHLIGVVIFLNDNEDVIRNRHDPQFTSKFVRNHLGSPAVVISRRREPKHLWAGRPDDTEARQRQPTGRAGPGTS
jgi:hypothetical protein